MNMILAGDGHNNIEKIDIEYEDEKGKKYKIKDKEYSDQYFLKSNNGILVNDDFTKLREFIYENSYVEYIISLPAKSFYPYAMKNDGFTLDTKRKAKEGENDLDIFRKYKDGKEEKLGFSKLDMETIRNNNYVSIPNVYRKFTFDSQYDMLPLKELVEETIEKNDINAPENFKEKRTSENTSDYKLVFPQCFAYNPSYVSVGSINYNDNEEIGCSEKFKEQVNNYAFGAVRESLSFEDFQKIQIPIPSLQEQEKIIAGLSKINQSIRNSQQIIKNLNTPLFISLMKSIKTEKLGSIANFEYGWTAKANDIGKYRFIQTGDIDKYGNILEQEKKYVDLPNSISEDKFLLKERDIITARHGNCGRTAIFKGNEKAIFTNDLIRIKFNKEVILPEYY
ncbi:15217_t:CDS:2 [Funneliformis geosporum]|nr:15217_t:CDS:2 [Funneliformis geosporum]